MKKLILTFSFISDIGREVEREFPVIVVVLVLAIAITLSIIGLVLCLIQKKPKANHSQPAENRDIQQKALTSHHSILKKNNKSNKAENMGVRVTVNKLEEMLGESSPLTSSTMREPLHSTYLVPPHPTAPDSGEDHLQPVYDLPRAGYGYYTARDSSEKSFKR